MFKEEISPNISRSVPNAEFYGFFPQDFKGPCVVFCFPKTAKSFKCVTVYRFIVKLTTIYSSHCQLRIDRRRKNSQVKTKMSRLVSLF